MTQRHLAFNNNVSVNFDITPVSKRTAQVETRRIAQHHTRKQQFFRLLSLIDTLQTGKLKTVIYAVSFADARRMNGCNFMAFVMRHRDDIGDVVFTLRVVVVQF
ncbi:hypothetical protein D3C87_1957210 [compost metagenome]